ncbi:MAG: ABC transporter substrate-binding protein [Rhodobacteraceae bacterium]|nr:ABC transporter substrate-binding protein [Paracoccaceae bacterium]
MTPTTRRSFLGMARTAVLGFALAFGISSATSELAIAKTPADTFVMAKDISDIITLDPAEVFELSGGEVIANIYDRITMYEPEDLKKLVGGVVESWDFSADGKTITFKMRSGLKFHSGNPVTSEDAAYSLKRVVHLSKTPSFIVTQFGWKADNVDSLIKVIDAGSFSVSITEPFSPALVLNALSAGIGSVVDSKLVKSHEKDGDWGYEWMKTNSAGSGAFSLKAWKANETVVLDRFDGYRHGPAKMKRVIVRHVAEPSAQRLLLEKGDVDLARNLTPDQIKGIGGNADLSVDDSPKGTVVYMAANQTHPILSNPKVMDAIRHAVDYKGMAGSFLAGQWVVHQSFWPKGLWAAYEETPYALDIDKAKTLLNEAGYADGFTVRINTLTASPFPELAQAIQGTLAQAGIKSKIQTQEGKTLWPMYRARKHELILARWSPDYVDPHSNADAFTHNPDNRIEAKLTGKLTWRNSFSSDELNTLTDKARQSSDPAERKSVYADLQKKLMDDGPFVIMFQQNDQEARRKALSGFVSGPTFDMVFYRNVSK